MNINYDFGNDIESEEYSYEVDYDELKAYAILQIAKEKRITLDEAVEYWEIDEEEWLDEHEEDIKEHFEEQAYEEYTDSQALFNDPYGYYGLSERDFI